MKRFLLALSLVFLWAAPLSAQTPVRPCYQTGPKVTDCQPVTASNPLPVSIGGSGGGTVTTTTVNSTISVTSTFQAALAASTTRQGCLLQNTGFHVEYIYFGVISSATTSNGYVIQPGQTISCAAGIIVLKDAVNITGTSGDGYIVTSQ